MTAVFGVGETFDQIPVDQRVHRAAGLRAAETSLLGQRADGVESPADASQSLELLHRQAEAFGRHAADLSARLPPDGRDRLPEGLDQIGSGHDISCFP